MSRESDTNPERWISADRDTVRAWGEEHNMVPVREESDEESRVDVVHESERRDAHEELTWDDFGREVTDRGYLVVRDESEDPPVGVYDRSEILGREAVERGEGAVERREEDVETTPSAGRVVEHRVVEEATVQSEIVDREILRTETVDVQLLTSDVDHVAVSRAGDVDESADAVSRFEPGTTLDEPYDVEFEIDEGWTLTKELLERVTIESRVLETDVHDAETVQSDTAGGPLDTERIQQNVLEGELVGSSPSSVDVGDSGHVESQMRDNDVHETHLIRRKTVEEEMSVRKEFSGQVSDGETLSADAIARTDVESEIVDEDEYDVDLLDRAGAATDTSATGGRATTEGTATTTGPVSPTEDEEGKTVVNSAGDQIGLVTDVEGGTMYVDPHASLTDRIRTALGWGGRDEDTYPIDTDQVARIEDDEVVLGFDEHR